jgi:4-amino-4-deoxy-L-arabinose transferase-like glycosyltransferase
MKNWKTTSQGILTIAASVIAVGLAYLKTGTLDVAALTGAFSGITAGLGLIKAADAPSQPPSAPTRRLSSITSLFAVAVALLLFPSCMTITAPDGTTTKQPDAAAITASSNAALDWVSYFRPKKEPKVVIATK